jgi:hypothetical protein
MPAPFPQKSALIINACDKTAFRSSYEFGKKRFFVAPIKM